MQDFLSLHYLLQHLSLPIPKVFGLVCLGITVPSVLLATLQSFQPSLYLSSIL
jgi:hypothetical protein